MRVWSGLMAAAAALGAMADGRGARCQRLYDLPERVMMLGGAATGP